MTSSPEQKTLFEVPIKHANRSGVTGSISFRSAELILKTLVTKISRLYIFIKQPRPRQ